MQAAPLIIYHVLDLLKSRLKFFFSMLIVYLIDQKRANAVQNKNFVIRFRYSDHTNKHSTQADITVYIHITVSQLQ